MAIAIKAENLSKAYQLGEFSTGTISRDIERWLSKIRGKEDPFLKIGETNDRTKKGSSDVVWSLKDICFEIKQGDAVGIIGRNGAGKSTLLKLLSRVTSPTSGDVRVKGRIASLLEVGTGFHPELTGRENIFLNGAILGMRKQEIRRKLDEIVQFAGVERYIDTPVKRYSSGMYVRLAFAVAAHLECEILIIDEVLAVGDAEFQKKCLGKMSDVSKGEGRTILFVSHNMSAIETLCSKSILLHNGSLKLFDNSKEVINLYLDVSGSKERVDWKGIDGSNEVFISEAIIKNKSNSTRFLNGDELEVVVRVSVEKDFEDLVIGFNLKNQNFIDILRVNYNDFNEYSKITKGLYEIAFYIPAYFLSTGTYSIWFDLGIPHTIKLSSDKSVLSFEIFAESLIGNRYMVNNSTEFNSIIRPNFFSRITKILPMNS